MTQRKVVHLVLNNVEYDITLTYRTDDNPAAVWNSGNPSPPIGYGEFQKLYNMSLQGITVELMERWETYLTWKHRQMHPEWFKDRGQTSG